MAGSSKKGTRKKSKDYPAYTLSAVIETLKRLKDYSPDKPIAYSLAAKECGMSPRSKSFSYMLSSARQYGLIATAEGKSFTLLASGNRMIHAAEDEASLQMLWLECFSTPKLYSDLIAIYKGKSLPEVAALENILVASHGILPTVAKRAAQTFLDTANEVGVVQNGILDLDISPKPQRVAEEPRELPEDRADKEDRAPAPAQEPAAPTVPTEEFSAPFNIPFGGKRRAVLYMPGDTTPDEAVYVQNMISLMFQQVYGERSN